MSEIAKKQAEEGVILSGNHQRGVSAVQAIMVYSLTVLYFSS